MLEQPPDITACLTDGQSPRPVADAGVIGELGKSMCGHRQLIAHLLGVSIAVGADRIVDYVIADRWECRLILREGLLNAVGV